jgi:hypothetical protein
MRTVRLAACQLQADLGDVDDIAAHVRARGVGSLLPAPLLAARRETDEYWIGRFDSHRVRAGGVRVTVVSLIARIQVQLRGTGVRDARLLYLDEARKYVVASEVYVIVR